MSMTVLKVARSPLPTRFGNFDIHIYRDLQHEHVVLTVGTLRAGCLVRVHSECITDDVFGSLRCDCGEPRRIAAHDFPRR
jgi:GTP cyclohydrolase II